MSYFSSDDEFVCMCKGTQSGKYTQQTEHEREEDEATKKETKNKINTTNNRAIVRWGVGGCWLGFREEKKMRMEYVNARTLKWNEGKKRNNYK